MLNTLKLHKSKRLYIEFEIPKKIEFNSKFYDMNSPANLIAALNRLDVKLYTLFDFSDFENQVKKETAKINRKKIFCELSLVEVERRNKKKNELHMHKRIYRKCVICEKECKKDRAMHGTCSEICKQKKLIILNENISKAHWCNSSKSKKIHDQKIKTRKINDKIKNRIYVPWNKGKTGIYSSETIKKISDAAIKQFSEQKFKKTKIEKMYESLLQLLHVEYTYSYIFNRRQFDFFLPKYNLIVEVQGDFWHGNPKIWGNTKPLREHQKMKRLDDAVKKHLVLSNGYRFVEFWEDDFYKNFDYIAKTTKDLLGIV